MTVPRDVRKKIAASYRKGEKIALIAKRFGVSDCTVSAIAKEAGCPPRYGYVSFDKVPDPTPEEIEKRAAEIRATWSDETYYQRAAVNMGVVPYKLPVFSRIEVFSRVERRCGVRFVRKE